MAQSRGQLEAQLAKAKAALSLALQNLDHTVIRAPVAGVIGNRQAQIGEFVGPGTQLMTVVPMNTIYVIANFKETQIGAMRVGQPVKIEVDAFPGAPLRGSVESFSAATGARFALLPPDNATGNFTKVVQRVPVRIKIDDVPAQVALRPGLSVELTVDTRR